jgi:hypothetical protein
MSGYLQRLIATASGAQSSVRPLVRAGYSPSVPDWSDEPVSSVLDGHVNSAYQFEPAAKTAAARESGSDIADDESSEERRGVPAHQIAIPRVSAFEPLLRTENTRPESSDDIAASPGMESAEVESLPTRAAVRASRTEQTHGPTAKTTEYSPLRSATRVGSRSDRADSDTQKQNPPKLPKSAPESRSAPSATAADEIQIHIGRIEVTAVPVVRPAPQKPVNRGPSLQEYLKRRGSLQ